MSAWLVLGNGRHMRSVLPLLSGEVERLELILHGTRLQNKVIDIEVDNGTPSPTVDPSVHVVLVGHSMGYVSAPRSMNSNESR